MISNVEYQKVEYQKVKYQKVEIRKSRINKVSDATYISDVVFSKKLQLKFLAQKSTNIKKKQKKSVVGLWYPPIMGIWGDGYLMQRRWNFDPPGPRNDFLQEKACHSK